jgi:hypothetical protein
MNTQQAVVDRKPPQPEALTITSPTPSDLLRIAVSQNADIDKLKQLMDLQERWERNEARKAFVAAMTEFKKDPPLIIKNKHVQFGQTNYNHATLDQVCDAVIKGLSAHGISHRWKVDQSDKEWIKVTCILTHDLGHFEETTLQGAPDNSGSKNSIQAIGSSVTYLQRYTLLAATGLAASNDTDGRAPASNGNGSAAGPAPLSRDTIAEQIEWMMNAHTLDELQRLFRNAYREADTAKDKAAQAAYIKAKDARKRELQ